MIARWLEVVHLLCLDIVVRWCELVHHEAIQATIWSVDLALRLVLEPIWCTMLILLNESLLISIVL